ncbi:MAG TPA: hypothetical protein ENK41_06305 [Rhodobacteraceae bacterium]|nr:hypothetical protein [Paracoccaceae bacterium]
MTQPLPSVSFDINGSRQTITLPPPGDGARRSVFVVSLPKAGSTLLNRIMRPLCLRAGLAPFSLQNTLRGELGVDMPQVDFNPLFVSHAYAYLGFRGWSTSFAMPKAADGRTVFLVRDPRDMVVSQYYSKAFSHRPPGNAAGDEGVERFEKERAQVARMSVADYVLENAESVARTYNKTWKNLQTIGHKTWRYEDIIFEKRRWVDEMLAYLGIDLPPAMVARVVERQDVRPDGEAPLEHVRKVTPGDHREKLDAATIEKLDAVFADILDRFDYPRATAS